MVAEGFEEEDLVVVGFEGEDFEEAQQDSEWVVQDLQEHLLEELEQHE